MTPARPCCRAAWLNELRPPKQNPTVNTALAPPPSGARRWATAAAASVATPSGVVCSVGLVVEALAPVAHPRGSAEVVDRGRVHPGLREPLGELLVEVVEASDVRQDHGARPTGRGRGGRVRAERRPVRGLQHVSADLPDSRPAGDR